MSILLPNSAVKGVLYTEREIKYYYLVLEVLEQDYKSCKGKYDESTVHRNVLMFKSIVREVSTKEEADFFWCKLQTDLENVSNDTWAFWGFNYGSPSIKLLKLRMSQFP